MMPTIKSMTDENSPESFRAAVIRLQRAATDARSRASTWRRLDVLEQMREEIRIAKDYEDRLRIAADVLESGLRAEQLRQQEMNRQGSHVNDCTRAAG